MAELAVLAVAGAGAAGAGALGISASVGWIVGTIVGQLLFPQTGPDTQGPRLGDLSVTSSTFGAPIPKGYGTMRRAGNLIWSSGIEEQSKKVKTGGKGGGSTHTGFTYFASFAISFGEGPAAGVLRLWADGKLIYDRTGLEDDVVKDGLQFRFYPGDETQLPDSLIEADVGVDNTPAYRGQTYIVFERLPLADYGNRIPNITAEVAHTLVNAVPVTEASILTDTLTTVDGNAFAIDWKRGYAYVLDTTGDATNTGIRRFNIRTMEEDRQLTSILALGQDLNGVAEVRAPMVVTPGGDIVMQIDTVGGTNAEPFVSLDSNNLRETGRFGAPGSGLLFTPTTWALADDMAVISLTGPLGTEDFVLCQSQFTSFGIIAVTAGMNFVWSTDVFLTSLGSSRMRSVCGGSQGISEGKGYAFAGATYSVASSEALVIWEIKISAGAAYALLGGVDTFAGVVVDTVASLTPGQLIPGETSLKNAGEGSVYDEIDDTVIFHAQADSDNKHYIIKVDPATGSVVWRTEVAAGANNGRSWSQSRLTGSTFGYLRDFKGYMLDTRTGELLVNGDTFAVEGLAGEMGAFESGSDLWIGLSNNAGELAKWYFNRKTGGTAAISDIVTDVCDKVSLDAADIDVTDLTDDTIDGYAISRQMNARSAIQPLASAFFFDGVESDFKIDFVERGGASIRTITQAELGIVDRDLGLFLRENRTQEPELPVRFSISYMDKSNAYQAGMQSARRIKLPTPAMFSDNQMGLSIPGVFEAQDAKRIAERKLYTSWLERFSQETRLAWDHADLDPTDVVTINLDDGTSIRARIVKSDMGVDLGLETTLIQEEVGQYVSTVASDKGTGPLPQDVPSSFVTKLLLLDTPLLRDSDEAPGRAFIQMHFLMGGYGQGGWKSGNLFKSSDGNTFDEIGRAIDEMTWGTIAGILGDPPNDDPFTQDDTNSITVAMTTSDDVFSTVTQLELVNGANPAAIIKANGEIEIIQFRDVTDNGNGTFTLSSLLRGRRGTDTMAFTHLSGEIFVLLNNTDVDVFPLSLSELSALRYYRGVGTGQILEDSDLVPNTSLGRALIPYAPVFHEAVEDGSNNLDLAWKRRTRVGGPLHDAGDIVPLNEDTEEYELEIFDGPGGSIVRTVLALTSPDYEYTQANIQSDLDPHSLDPMTVTNPGAETGDTTGWTTTGVFTVRSASPSPHDGSFYFYGGPSSAGSDTAEQDLAVPGTSFGDVDAGDGIFVFNWWQNSFAGSDTGRVDVEFFDESMVSQGSGASSALAPVTWTLRTLSLAIPTTTRTIRVTLVATKFAGSNNDAYFDLIHDVGVRVDLLVPTQLTMKVYQISAQVGRGFSREVTVDVS